MVELLNAADRQRERHFSSGQQPSNMPVRHQCSALRSGIAPPRLHSILGHWLVDLRIVLRVVGQLALDWMLDDTRG